MSLQRSMFAIDAEIESEQAHAIAPAATQPAVPAHDAKRAQQQQALARATNGTSLSNYAPIFEGFSAMGIPVDQIQPRENVFTFNAWKAKGRYVRKGEHGVKVVTWIEAKTAREANRQESAEDSPRAHKFARATTVFHISQTEEATR